MYDKPPADSQFITHKMGRVLTSPTPPISTKGYETLKEELFGHLHDLTAPSSMLLNLKTEGILNLDMSAFLLVTSCLGFKGCIIKHNL